jgi:tRNA threonylcarbamoyladenosine biosynthesis protein TsaB
MPYILSVDTSTKACSVAIHHHGQLLGHQETYTENSHAENLVSMIQEVCKQSGVALKQIDAFALAKGPGSYTGLRIGSSTIKGLCFVFDKPMIATSTLRLMAEPVLPTLKENELACPMLDARRMEVYTAAYDHSGRTILEETPLVLDENSFSELLIKYPIVFVGNGAAKCEGVFQNGTFRFAPEIHPLATNMGKLAYESFRAHAFVDLAYFEPEYLKEFYTTAKIVA